MVKLGRRITMSGGGAKLPGFTEAKKRWTGDFEYQYRDQSSLLGAAMLGRIYQQGGFSPVPRKILTLQSS